MAFITFLQIFLMVSDITIGKLYMQSNGDSKATTEPNIQNIAKYTAS